jgi:hypothetical protein
LLDGLGYGIEIPGYLIELSYGLVQTSLAFGELSTLCADAIGEANEEIKEPAAISFVVCLPMLMAILELLLDVANVDVAEKLILAQVKANFHLAYELI